MKAMTIGQVARQAGVGVETIRFYERRGLIEEPPRRESGYRQYPEETIARIEFIKRAKELGFSLKEISELLSLRMDPDTTCNDLREKAEAKVADIQAKIKELRRIERAVSRLAASCHRGGPKSRCPVLAALDGEKDL